MSLTRTAYPHRVGLCRSRGTLPGALLRTLVAQPVRLPIREVADGPHGASATGAPVPLPHRRTRTREGSHLSSRAALAIDLAARVDHQHVRRVAQTRLAKEGATHVHRSWDRHLDPGHRHHRHDDAQRQGVVLVSSFECPRSQRRARTRDSHRSVTATPRQEQRHVTALPHQR